MNVVGRERIGVEFLVGNVYGAGVMVIRWNVEFLVGRWLSSCSLEN